MVFRRKKKALERIKKKFSEEVLQKEAMKKERKRLIHCYCNMNSNQNVEGLQTRPRVIIYSGLTESLLQARRYPAGSPYFIYDAKNDVCEKSRALKLFWKYSEKALEISHQNRWYMVYAYTLFRQGLFAKNKKVLRDAEIMLKTFYDDRKIDNVLKIILNNYDDIEIFEEKEQYDYAKLAF